MLQSGVLDVAIGLIFVYLLLALICTTINEWVAGILKTRPVMLEKGIANLLQGVTAEGNQALQAFGEHPLIAGLGQGGSTPSYIAPRTFALAVMDLVTPQQPGVITFDDLEAGIKRLPESSLKRSLLALIQNTGRDLDRTEKAIEGWFNDTMDRVTGWYARDKQKLTIVISAALTLFVNADTIGMANRLWVNPTLRQEIVNRATASQNELKDLVTAEYKDSNPKPTKPEKPQPLTQIEQVSAKLGDLAGWTYDWNKADKNVSAVILLALWHIPGWILTIIAVSLGAPFWFDTLKTFVNLRSAGKKPVTPPQSKSGSEQEA